MRVTAAILTIGGATLRACRLAIIDQPCQRIEIHNVRPFAAAMNEAVRRCDTELLVQVDEDMILRPDAIDRLVRLIDSTPANTVMASAPLWDADVEMPIYGCKIYRVDLLRSIPFEPHVLGDAHDREVWARHGLTTHKAERTEANVVGLHGTAYTPEQAFARWRGLWQRHRRTGGKAWIEPWVERLAQRYKRSGSERDLAALAGVLIGMTEPLWPEDLSNVPNAYAEIKRWI